MKDFVTADHMTLFGRPLWRAHKEKPCLLRTIVKRKIVCSVEYDPNNVNHVFAALSSRLCLDVCMEGSEAIALAREAVNSHLRILNIERDTISLGQDKKSLERMVTM